MKTGNVKNVAAFGKLVGICNDLGASYNPSKEALTPTALASLLEQAQLSLEAVNVARINHALAVNARQQGFAGMHTLAARVVRALIASGSSVEDIRDAMLITRKFASKPGKPISTKPGSQEGSTPANNTSSSRRDYDGMLDTFSNLVQLVQSLPEYQPNEPELAVAALKAYLIELRYKSVRVAECMNALAQARMNRNQVMLGKNGLFAISITVKAYIRSVFGMKSEASKELSKLRIAA